MSDIQLLHTDAGELLNRDSRFWNRKVDFVMLDPPWSYDNDGGHGGLRMQYSGLKMIDIATQMAATYYLCRDDAYLVLWCTFPMLSEWVATWELTPEGVGWKYVSGGCWGKVNGLGVGTHFRGDAELILLYRKGAPKPLTTQSNLILTEQGTNNLVLAPRIGHSEKPQEALRPLVEMCCPVGGLVLDLYAGQSASMARACRATDRDYLGCEIDEVRWEKAMHRLAMEEQVSMF